MWLRRDAEREGRGRCEVCKCSFKTNKGWSGVVQHSKTRKQVKNMEQLLTKGQGKSCSTGRRCSNLVI